MKNGIITLDNSLGIFFNKVKHNVTVRPRNSTPKYLPKINKNIVSRKTCSRIFLLFFTIQLTLEFWGANPLMQLKNPHTTFDFPKT